MTILKKLTFISFYVVSLFFLTTLISCNPRQSKVRDNTSLQIENKPVLINTVELLKKDFKGIDSIRNIANSSVISWNIQDLGQTKNNEEIAFMANLLKGFDIVAIQEVVAKHPAGAQKVAQLVDELNRRGAKWDYRISDPTKSPSVYMSERYAFLWKTSQVSLQGRAYLDKDLENEIHREPYIAQFKLKKTNQFFYIVNFHSRKHDDNPELEIKFF